jgi:hypothetical protein
MKECNCGNQIANNADSCPKCGHEFSGGAKKALIASTVLMQSLDGEGNEGKASPASSELDAIIEPSIAS